MSNLKLPSVLKPSGGKLSEGEVFGSFFFLERIVREGAVRGGTVLVGELTGEELSDGNCPGGEFTGHRHRHVLHVCCVT